MDVTDEMVDRAILALMNYRRNRYGHPPTTPETEWQILHVRRHGDDTWHRREEMRTALEAALNA